jgi:hypothetical protein
VVRATKRAWRMGYYGLAAVIAVAWDTQTNSAEFQRHFVNCWFPANHWNRATTRRTKSDPASEPRLH